MRMINKYIPWAGIGITYVMLCAGAILDQRWYDTAITVVGIIAVAVGVYLVKQEKAELRWKNQMLEAQDQQIRVMRRTRHDHH